MVNYYIQHIGDTLLNHKNRDFDLVLLSGDHIQPKTLSSADESVSPYDYTEVDVVAPIEKVVLMKEILVADKFDCILDGFIKVNTCFAVYGDKTEVTMVEFKLRRADSVSVVAQSKYEFRTPITGNNGSYGASVYAAMTQQVNNVEIDGMLSLQISIIGKVAEGDIGKVAFIHIRGNGVQNLVLPVKKPHYNRDSLAKVKRTRIINRKDVDVTKLEKVLSLDDEHGTIRELTIVSPVKPSIFIVCDNIDMFASHNSYDDLATISEFSETIVAIQSAALDYVVNIKNIRFTENITIEVGIPGSSTIDNIFCIYDIEVEHGN